MLYQHAQRNIGHFLHVLISPMTESNKDKYTELCMYAFVFLKLHKIHFPEKEKYRKEKVKKKNESSNSNPHLRASANANLIPTSTPDLYSNWKKFRITTNANSTGVWVENDQPKMVRQQC